MYPISYDDEPEKAVVVDVAFRFKPKNKRKKYRAKKIVVDASSIGGSGLGMRDQDTQVLFPGAQGGGSDRLPNSLDLFGCALVDITHDVQAEKLELESRAKRFGKDMVASGLPDRVEIELMVKLI
uniref:Uncharacterized protein n=1 Tax=Tanacetum cinerariifolium TaxID=118510 RepID=A0A6L2NIQ5_TANCI|nr:hypothetical protein [Tanacetum cinerariifolium]